MGKHIFLGFGVRANKIEPRGGIVTGRNLRKNYVKCERCGKHVYMGDLPNHVCKNVIDEDSG